MNPKSELIYGRPTKVRPQPVRLRERLQAIIERERKRKRPSGAAGET